MARFNQLITVHAAYLNHNGSYGGRITHILRGVTEIHLLLLFLSRAILVPTHRLLVNGLP